MEIFLKKFLAAVVILSVSFTAKAEWGQFPCGYNYFSDARGWFKMHADWVSWSEANRICNSEGAELASPLNDDMKDAMMSLMYDIDLKNNQVLGVRTIHTALAPTGNMINEAGIQVLAGRIGLSDKGQFRIISELIALPYICYKRAPQKLQLNECGSTDPEYTLDSRTNKCYKFHRNRKTWYSAVLMCVEEGGHLAIINSEEEAQVIREVFAKNPAEIIPGVSWKDSAFLGFWADYNRTWSTIDEQPLSDCGYEEWAPGEPNNARGDELCGSVGRNGKLFDDPCYRTLPFICEKRKDSCENLNRIPNVTTVGNLIQNRARDASDVYDFN